AHESSLRPPLRTEKEKEAYHDSAHGHSKSGPRLQKVEQIFHPETFAFEIWTNWSLVFRKGKKRETILGSPENRASPPETHGFKFLNSLFRASLRWDQ